MEMFIPHSRIFACEVVFAQNSLTAATPNCEMEERWVGWLLVPFFCHYFAFCQNQITPTVVDAMYRISLPLTLPHSHSNAKIFHRQEVESERKSQNELVSVEKWRRDLHTDELDGREGK